MAEKQYTKTMVVNTTDGSTITLNQGAAHAFLRQVLENNPRYIRLTDEKTGVETWIDAGSAGCGFCKVATVTPGSKDAEEVPCEDGLPDCKED